MQSLLWVVRLAQNIRDQREVHDALATLVQDYADAPLLEEATDTIEEAGYVIGTDQAQAFLRLVASQSPYAATRAAAWYHVANSIVQDTPVTQAKSSQAHEALNTLQTTYATSRYGQKAARLLFELDRLQVGMMAPDFEAKDQDGAVFKLSDYRHQVVVLCFWGMWCGPCRALLPNEKALVAEFKGKPFALIGVNSDGNQDKVRDMLRSQEITWRNAVDESMDGSLASQWNVHAWPQIYIIDASGMIRYKDITGKQIHDSITLLLRATPQLQP